MALDVYGQSAQQQQLTNLQRNRLAAVIQAQRLPDPKPPGKIPDIPDVNPVQPPGGPGLAQQVASNNPLATPGQMPQAALGRPVPNTGPMGSIGGPGQPGLQTPGAVPNPANQLMDQYDYGNPNG